MKGELWGLGGECSNPFEEGKVESDPHRWLVPPSCTPQPKTHIFWCGWGLDAEAWALEVRHREKAGLAVQRQPEGARVWQMMVYLEEAWAHQRGNVPLLGDM